MTITLDTLAALSDTRRFVLASLLDVSADNGHAFAMVEDVMGVIPCDITVRTAKGAITALVKAGIIIARTDKGTPEESVTLDPAVVALQEAFFLSLLAIPGDEDEETVETPEETVEAVEETVEAVEDEEPITLTVASTKLAVTLWRDRWMAEVVRRKEADEDSPLVQALWDDLGSTIEGDTRKGVVKAVQAAFAAIKKASAPVPEPTAGEIAAAAAAAAKRALREARADYDCVSTTDMTPRDEDGAALAVCPSCGTVAEGEEEIDSVFGIRKMKAFSDAAGTYKLTIRVQSYCKACRSKHAKARRSAGLAA